VYSHRIMKAHSAPFARLMLPAFLAALVAAAAGPAAAAGEPAPVTGRPLRFRGIEAREIARGVFAVLRTEPVGLANHANNAFIVCDSDVVVVDAAFTLAATRDVVSLLKKLTDRPVSYVINTHWHDDHTFGNQVYREAWPGVKFLAQVFTREDMAGIGVSNRKAQVAGGPQALAAIRGALEKGRNLDGTALASDEQAAYRSTLAIAGQYLDEMPGFRLTLPTITFRDRMTLVRGGRTIDILHFGPGNTRGDAVVFLPAERVLIAGDLVDVPAPAAAGSDLGGWIAALGKLRALAPLLVVPGHGPLLAGDEAIRGLEQMLISTRAQTDSAVARGKTLEQALQSVDLGRFRRALTGSEKMAGWFFDNYFKVPAVSGEFQRRHGKPGPAPVPTAEPPR
jgi:cyclase